jgi:hypothetical protein
MAQMLPPQMRQPLMAGLQQLMPRQAPPTGPMRPGGPTQQQMPQLPPVHQDPQNAPDAGQQQWRTPYRAATPRDHAQWGQEWGPLWSSQFYPGGELPLGLPSGREATGVIMGAGRQLGLWGPMGVSQPAMQASNLARMLQGYAPILDLISGGKFSQNQARAQLDRMKLLESQMALQAEIASNESNRILQKWSRIYAAFEEGGLTPEQAHDEAERLSYETHDPNIRAVLKSRGMDGVEAYLKYIDSTTRDLAAGAASTRKGSKTNAESPFLSDQGGMGSGTLQHREDPLAASTIAAAEKAAAAPTAGTDAGTESPEQLVERLKRPLNQGGLGLNDAGLDVARQGVSDPEVLSKLSGNEKKQITGASSAMRGTMERIAREQGEPLDRTAPDYEQKRRTRILDKLDKIGQVDPTIGSLAHDMYNYKADLDRVPIHQRMFVQGLLGEATDHHWRAGNYKQIQELTSEKGQIGKVLTRVGEFGTGGLPALWEAVKETRGSEWSKQTIPPRVLQELLADKYTGDPRYSKLYTAINSAINQVGGIINLSGQAHVTTAHDWMLHNAPGKSPAQILEQFHVDFNDAWAILNHAQDRWHQLTGRDTLIPNLSKTDWEYYSAFARANWTHGTMPSDAPPNLRAISTPMGRDIAGGDNRVPLPYAKLRDINKLYQKYQHDPSKQAQLDELIKYLPITVSPASNIPPLQDEEERE